MKLFCCSALTAALVLCGSLSNARGAPPSSFVPRSSHQDRATLSHKHNAKAGQAGARRNHYTPRTPPPK